MEFFRNLVLSVLLSLSLILPISGCGTSVGVQDNAGQVAFVETRSKLTQIQAFNCDFDDNIFVTNAKIMVWDSVKQEEVAVSTANWALIRDELGKEGPYKNYALRNDSLRFFGDTGPAGLELFQSQIAEALTGGKWKAPSWNAFVEALSNEETRKHTTIITARLHSPDAIMRGLELLKENNLIPALPNRENIFSVGWPWFDEKFKGASSAESKANVMLHLLDEVEKRPVPADATLVDNRDGNGKEKLHLWGFSDDDYGNFEKALSVLSKEVAKNRWPHVKVVLFYTGLNNPKHKMHSLVIKSDGRTRPTSATEGTRMK